MRGSKVEKCFPPRELCDRANVTVTDSTPIRFYIRTAEQLFQQAKIYQLEGDLQTSYILYMRFCNELPKHGEYSNPGYKPAIIRLKRSAMVALGETEAMKPTLDKKYNEYQEYIRQREELIRDQALEAQLQLESQRQFEIEKEIKEQQERQWAHHPPEQGWSLAKALEGVPGPPPALPRKPVAQATAPKLPPKTQVEEDVHEFSQGLRKLIVPSRNKLTVTTLIIPKQTATSDTCSTTNEDELFEFQSERDLMTLGWIHDACDQGHVELMDLDLNIVDLRKK
ncbi:hypothetical protein EDD11_006112 [Mortierella claussenii]|nr:hypothetical protein EDD11_006112 [Mortierella claussenii]